MIIDNSKITMTTEQKWKLPFLLIVIGQSISLIGSSAVQFALIWWITSGTNSALLLGLSGMVAYVPVVLFSPAAGVIADRYNRKVICICADLFVGMSAAAFALLLWLYEMPIWISLKQRLMFIAIKTEDGVIKGKISFYCRMLRVSRQAFNNYLKTKDSPWKYQPLADAMLDICKEDECNDTYGRIRMYQALQLKQPGGVPIPSERTVYRLMEEIGLNHKSKRKPNGITKANKEARKLDDLIKRDFTAEKGISDAFWCYPS